MLTRDQVTHEIREWMGRVHGAELQLNALAAMTGDINYDAPLPAAIEGLIEGYSAAVGLLVGDEGGWLEYFRIDCAFGDSPMAVIPESGAAEIQIDGPEALARVICWDREHGEAER